MIKNQESIEIDVTRILANYLVVLIHAWAAFQYCSYGIEFVTWQFVCNGVGSIAMSPLFLISGYLMASKCTSIKEYGNKIIRRARRLLIPYFVWNCLMVIIYLLLGGIVPRLAARIEQFEINTIQGVLTKTCSIISPPIDMPLWYIRAIFLYCLLSCVFIRLIKRIGSPVVIGLGIIGVALSHSCGIGDDLMFSYPVYSWVAFFFGVYLSINNISPFEFFRSRAWYFVGVAGAISMGLLFVKYWWSYSIYRDVAFLMATPLLFKIGDILSPYIYKARFYKQVKSTAFFVYCGHFLFCSCVLHLIAPLLRSINLGRLSLLIVVFSLGVPLMLMFHYTFSRIASTRRILRLFSGDL